MNPIDEYQREVIDQMIMDKIARETEMQRALKRIAPPSVWDTTTTHTYPRWSDNTITTADTRTLRIDGGTISSGTITNGNAAITTTGGRWEYRAPEPVTMEFTVEDADNVLRQIFRVEPLSIHYNSNDTRTAIGSHAHTVIMDELVGVDSDE